MRVDTLPENQRDDSEIYVEDQERGERAGFCEGSFWRTECAVGVTTPLYRSNGVLSLSSAGRTRCVFFYS